VSLCVWLVRRTFPPPFNLAHATSWQQTALHYSLDSTKKSAIEVDLRLGFFSQPSQPPQPRILGPINHGIHEPLDPCHAQEFKPCHYRCEREWEFAAGPRTMTSPCHRTDTGKDLPHLVCQLTPLGSMYFGLVL
jgi:hypothetical protein